MLQAGKGDRYRPVNTEKFNQNFDKIFRKNKKKEQKNDNKK
jgi:hypothetical protein